MTYWTSSKISSLEDFYHPAAEQKEDIVYSIIIRRSQKLFEQHVL